MIALNSILVATDFSEPSMVALRYARALAAGFGARLHILHVVPDPMALPWADVSDGLTFEAMQHDWEREARTRLNTLMSPEEQQQFGVRLVVRAGDVVRHIEQYAVEHGIDLLVVGTHGRGFMAHVLMGSVAERLVRTAPCPVLTVRHPQHDFVCETLVPLQEAVPRMVGA